MASIRVPTALRTFTAGASDVELEASTVKGALDALDAKHPGIAAKIFTSDGGVRPFIKIYVGADDIASLQGLDTPVSSRDEISIIPAIAGG